jgi:hypothetical protein
MGAGARVAVSEALTHPTVALAARHTRCRKSPSPTDSTGARLRPFFSGVAGDRTARRYAASEATKCLAERARAAERLLGGLGELSLPRRVEECHGDVAEVAAGDDWWD